jgi:hypothetical protein
MNARTWLAWGSALVAIALFIGLSLIGESDASVVLWFAVVTLFVLIGALLWTRVPSNPIGPMFLAAGILIVAFGTFGSYATLGAAATPPWPGASVARKLGDILFFYPIMIALVGIPLVFPDGRLASPRFRPVAALAVIGLVAWTIGATLGPGSGSPTDPIVLLATIVGFLGAAVSVASRFRGGDPIQRQQVKWLLADAILAAIACPIALMMPDPETAPVPILGIVAWFLLMVSLLLLPVVIGIAVLRYRLYEIDRLLSRTVSWGVVTGVLFGVFALVNLGLQELAARALLGTGVAQAEGVTVALATLIVAVLFQPIRTRVQRLVDRRFNRSRYDAERMTREFATRLRNEIDLGTLVDDLAATTALAVEPTSAATWLRKRDAR